ncbi:DgyrCDS10471 [Dimorphilus gyrociliatus]|uniref:DgyrCDS10471 n=1 Tax=Dimorphilus gyrociliatus TaxID=2664684 RepID=A0A7I8W1H2_9ANNE|nr:DgyrCDS10471 [Dimorphilus gyrociliatus]
MSEPKSKRNLLENNEKKETPNLCRDLLLCSIGPRPCFIPSCFCFPKLKESLTTRMSYAIFLGLIAILAILSQFKPVYKSLEFLDKVESQCDFYNVSSCPGEMPYPYLLAYRYCYSLVAFHLLLLPLTFLAENSQGRSGSIHNGFWLIKFLALIALIFGLFQVPVKKLILEIGLYVGMFGGLVFIVFCQLLSILSFAHRLRKKWLKNSERNICWKLVSPIVAFLCAAAIAGITYITIALYAMKMDCKVGTLEIKTIISLIVGLLLIIIVLLVGLSVISCVKRMNPNNSYLQALVVGVYVMYLIATSVTSIPVVSRGEKNATNVSNLLSNFELPKDCSMLKSAASVNLSFLGDLNKVMKITNYIGIGLMTGMAIYSAMITQLDKETPKAIQLRRKVRKFCCKTELKEETIPIDTPETDRIIRNDYHTTSYNYYILHFTFSCAALYILMNLTMWYKPVIASYDNTFQKANIIHFGRNWPAVFVKFGSAIMCLILYLITLFVPKIFGYDFTVLKLRKSHSQIEVSTIV